jgi:hypothetical protein
VLGVSCTNLEEEVLDGVTISNTSGGTVNSFTSSECLWRFKVLKHKDKCFLDEMSSDALVGLPVEVTGMTMESGDKPIHTWPRSCTGKKCMECFVVSSV